MTFPESGLGLFFFHPINFSKQLTFGVSQVRREAYDQRQALAAFPSGHQNQSLGR